MLSSAKDLIILTVLVGVASSICVALTWLIYHGLFKRKVRKDMYLLVEGLNEVHVDRGCRIWKLRGKGEDLVLTLENDHRKGSEIELEKYQEELIHRKIDFMRERFTAYWLDIKLAIANRILHCEYDDEYWIEFANFFECEGIFKKHKFSVEDVEEVLLMMWNTLLDGTLGVSAADVKMVCDSLNQLSKITWRVMMKGFYVMKESSVTKIFEMFLQIVKMLKLEDNPILCRFISDCSRPFLILLAEKWWDGIFPIFRDGLLALQYTECLCFELMEVNERILSSVLGLLSPTKGSQQQLANFLEKVIVKWIRSHPAEFVGLFAARRRMQGQPDKIFDWLDAIEENAKKKQNLYAAQFMLLFLCPDILERISSGSEYTAQGRRIIAFLDSFRKQIGGSKPQSNKPLFAALRRILEVFLILPESSTKLLGFVPDVQKDLELLFDTSLKQESDSEFCADVIFCLLAINPQKVFKFMESEQDLLSKSMRLAFLHIFSWLMWMNSEEASLQPLMALKKALKPFISEFYLSVELLKKASMNGNNELDLLDEKIAFSCASIFKSDLRLFCEVGDDGFSTELLVSLFCSLTLEAKNCPLDLIYNEVMKELYFFTKEKESAKYSWICSTISITALSQLIIKNCTKSCCFYLWKTLNFLFTLLPPADALPSERLECICLSALCSGNLPLIQECTKLLSFISLHQMECSENLKILSSSLPFFSMQQEDEKTFSISSLHFESIKHSSGLALWWEEEFSRWKESQLLLISTTSKPSVAFINQTKVFCALLSASSSLSLESGNTIPTSRSITSSLNSLAGSGRSEREVFIRDLWMLIEKDENMVNLIGCFMDPCYVPIFSHQIHRLLGNALWIDNSIFCSEKNTLLVDRTIQLSESLLSRVNATGDLLLKYLADFPDFISLLIRYCNASGSSGMAIKKRLCSFVANLLEKPEAKQITHEHLIVNWQLMRNFIAENIMGWLFYYSKDEGKFEAAPITDLLFSCFEVLPIVFDGLQVQPSDLVLEKSLEKGKLRLFKSYMRLFETTIKSYYCKFPETWRIKLDENIAKSIKNFIMWNSALLCVLDLEEYCEEFRDVLVDLMADCLGDFPVNSLLGGVDNSLRRASHSSHSKDIVSVLMEDKCAILNILSDTCPTADFDELAPLLLDSFISRGSELTLVESLIRAEIEKSEASSTLFRRNSVISRILTLYSKSVGKQYLSAVTEKLLNSLRENGEHYEIDPNKIDSPDNLNRNLAALQKVLADFIDFIIASDDLIPAELKKICNLLQGYVNHKYPSSLTSQSSIADDFGSADSNLPSAIKADVCVMRDKSNVLGSFTAVGGFIFLRFICPAITNPESILPPHLVKISASMKRGLIMVAKVMQNISNNVACGGKEEFMTPLNNFIAGRMEFVGNFLHRIACAACRQSLGECKINALNSTPSALDEDEEAVRKLTSYVIVNMDRLIKRNTNLKNLVTVTEAFKAGEVRDLFEMKKQLNAMFGGVTGKLFIDWGMKRMVFCAKQQSKSLIQWELRLHSPSQNINYKDIDMDALIFFMNSQISQCSQGTSMELLFSMRDFPSFFVGKKKSMHAEIARLFTLLEAVEENFNRIVISYPKFDFMKKFSSPARAADAVDWKKKCQFKCDLDAGELEWLQGKLVSGLNKTESGLEGCLIKCSTDFLLMKFEFGEDASINEILKFEEISNVFIENDAEDCHLVFVMNCAEKVSLKCNGDSRLFIKHLLKMYREFNADAACHRSTKPCLISNLFLYGMQELFKERILNKKPYQKLIRKILEPTRYHYASCGVDCQDLKKWAVDFVSKFYLYEEQFIERWIGEYYRALQKQEKCVIEGVLFPILECWFKINVNHKGSTELQLFQLFTEKAGFIAAKKRIVKHFRNLEALVLEEITQRPTCLLCEEWKDLMIIEFSQLSFENNKSFAICSFAQSQLKSAPKKKDLVHFYFGLLIAVASKKQLWEAPIIRDILWCAFEYMWEQPMYLQSILCANDQLDGCLIERALEIDGCSDALRLQKLFDALASCTLSFPLWDDEKREGRDLVTFYAFIAIFDSVPFCNNFNSIQKGLFKVCIDDLSVVLIVNALLKYPHLISREMSDLYLMILAKSFPVCNDLTKQRIIKVLKMMIQEERVEEICIAVLDWDDKNAMEFLASLPFNVEVFLAFYKDISIESKSFPSELICVLMNKCIGRKNETAILLRLLSLCEQGVVSHEVQSRIQSLYSNHRVQKVKKFMENMKVSDAEAEQDSMEALRLNLLKLLLK